jgi:hypothetical protein
MSSFLILALVTTASAQTRIVGVDVGDKFRYSVTATWSSDDPNATAPSYITDNKNTEWLEVNITAISGTNITGQSTKHYFNGTETTVDGWVDIENGTGHLMDFLISANLTAGDSLYNSTTRSNYLINETVPRTYLSSVRDTNYLNTTSMDATTNLTYSMYWDKLTGIVVDAFTENTYMTGNYTNSWSIELQIISSDLWVVPEFSAWTSALLMFIVLTSVIIIIYRQRRSTTLPRAR